MIKQKVTPFLWFENQAEEAAVFYVSLFKDSEITRTLKKPDGSVWTVEFKLAGVNYVALNGGIYYKLTEAFSLSIDCETQQEIDHYWEKLTENGGAHIQCGWLKDRFGLTWQVVPSVLPKLMADPQRGGKVMEALMTMTKLDIQKLKEAFDS